jgi:hypothetical protein
VATSASNSSNPPLLRTPMAISTANSHEERKHRAEQRNRGDRPGGPDWETAHADARPLTLTVSFLVLRASTTCPGSLTPTERKRRQAPRATAHGPASGSRCGEASRWISRAIMSAERIASPGASPTAPRRSRPPKWQICPLRVVPRARLRTHRLTNYWPASPLATGAARTTTATPRRERCPRPSAAQTAGAAAAQRLTGRP